jgi:hypothetical protein
MVHGGKVDAPTFVFSCADKFRLIGETQMPQELAHLPGVLRRAIVKQRDHLILGNTRSAFNASVAVLPNDVVLAAIRVTVLMQIGHISYLLVCGGHVWWIRRREEQLDVATQMIDAINGHGWSLLCLG